MKRIAACAMLLLCLGHSGCSLCCTPWDYAYAGYGGRAPREDRFHGRVGSVFEPAGAMPGMTHPYGYENIPTKPAEEVPPPTPDKMEEEAAPAESTRTSS
jgi:hypothetical protein